MTKAEREQQIFATARAAYSKALGLSAALGVPAAYQRAIDAGIESVRSLIAAETLREAAELPESDPRYLAPFMAGMRAARMAIVKRGWPMTSPITPAEAIDVIDNERHECVKVLAKGIEGAR